MTKTLFNCAVAMLLAVPAVNAQIYTSGSLTAITLSSTAHDSTWCHSTGGVAYNVTKSGSFMGDSIKVVDTVIGVVIFAAGNTTGDTSWTVIAPAVMFQGEITDDQLSGSTALFVMHPTKIISGTDTIGPIHDFFPLYVPDPCIYDTVSGTVYIDNNANCLYDMGDDPLNAMAVISTSNLSSPSVSTNFRFTYSYPTGYYNLKIQKSWMTSYSVALPTQYYFIYPLTSCFSGAYSYTTLPQGNVNFSLQCSDSVDVMSYSMYPPAIKYGREFYMEPYVSNTGCNPESGTLTFVKDHRVIYDPALSFVPATTVSGDTLQWSYTNLTNLTGGGYWNSLLSRIHLMPDTSAHVGDTLCFRIYSDIPATDIFHANNDQSICLPVVYAYDPNVKEVSPKGIGAPGYILPTTPRLSYTLHFQNTGTSYASMVRVVDTLDANVDPTSLRILGVSHSMTPEWLAPGVVRFNFNPIYLPDSTTDEAASHGSVSFSVKLNPSLPLGTQIKNKGYIYFDANPAVVTNTTLNTIYTSLQTQPVAAQPQFSIYPNPAHDLLYIESPEAGIVSVTDISGKMIIGRNIAAGKTTLDLHTLAPGLYIIRAISNEKVTTTKFIRE